MLKFSEPNKPATVIIGSNDTQFTKLLHTKWDELHQETDVFRYKIDQLEEKVIDGYLLQLNPDRSTKRRAPEQITDICQPFDSNSFNFTKVSPKEVIFNLVKEGNDADVHTLIVNVSPITRYHTLLCPSINKCLPQVVTLESLQLALEIMFQAQDGDLRIGFNSLCALASVNHLHYHLLFERNTLPVEFTKCKNIKGNLSCLENYPVPAFCFEVTKHYKNTISKDVFNLLTYFLKNSIAHNLFITKGKAVVPGDDKEGVVRVLVWPRKSSAGVKQLGAFNIAVCELSGWFPVYNKYHYENLKTKDLEDELLKWKIDDFEKLCEELKAIF